MKQILSIQYLRGVAALMVVWHHAKGQIPEISQAFTNSFGASGVDLFFVISGFIMVVTTQGADVTPWRFLKKRIVRVVPLYWLLTLALVVAALLFPSLFRTVRVEFWHVLKSLFFVPHVNPTHLKIWPILVPGWSLNYEMFFYALFAMSLAMRRSWRLIAIGLAIGGLVICGWMFGFQQPVAATFTNPLMLEFVLGIAIASAWLRSRLFIPVWGALALVMLGAVMLAHRGLFLPQMCGAALIVCGALNLPWKSVVLKTLGDASYSIYLTHLFALGVLRVLWVKVGATEPLMFMLCSLTLCSLVGWLSYRWLEIPLMRFKTRGSASGAPATVTATASVR